MEFLRRVSAFGGRAPTLMSPGDTSRTLGPFRRKAAGGPFLFVVVVVVVVAVAVCDLTAQHV